MITILYIHDDNLVCISFRFVSILGIHISFFLCVCVCRLLLRAECVYFNLSLSLLACIQFILFSFISFCVFIFLVGVSISLGESRYVCAMLCAVLFCSLTVKRRSHFLRNFWHEKIYYMNVYKMYFILNSMGFCLFHFRPLTHPLCIIFNSLFCELHCVTCMYTWFVHSFSSFFFFRIFPCSFPSTHFWLSFILHVRVCVWGKNRYRLMHRYVF